MNSLFLKYYTDITRINLLVAAVFAMVGHVFIGVLASFIICFGTFGMLVSFVVYSKFQKEQYYFYFNQGYTKTELITKVFAINFAIALFLFLIIK